MCGRVHLLLKLPRGKRARFFGCPGPSETARVLGHAIRDAALSVRVSASAALANLADTLRQAISRGPEPVTCTDSQAPMPVHQETWLAQIAEGVAPQSTALHLLIFIIRKGLSCPSLLQ